MSQESKHLEVEELLALMLDGKGLSPAQQARLQALVFDAPELLDQFVITVALVNDLQEMAAYAVSADGQVNIDQHSNRKTLSVVSRARGFSIAALAASLLIAAFSLSRYWLSDTQNVEQSSRYAEFVATIVAAEDWNASSTYPVGCRIPTGDFSVDKGIVELQFDSGPSLLVEGPAQVTIRSASEAQLSLGKVVFRDETNGLPFLLVTPRSRLIDHGTEYAVSVTDEDEEVHVFSGTVGRTEGLVELDQSVDLLEDGEAKRYSRNDQIPVEVVPADPTIFVRQLTTHDDDPAEKLLAIESFEYDDDTAVLDVQANGGAGWSSTWWPNGEKLSGHNEKDVALRVGDSLVFDGRDESSRGGSLGYVGEWLVHRPLNQELSLARNEVRYVSFLFRPDGLWSSPENTVKVIFQNPDQGILEHRIAVGIDVARGHIRGELCGVLGQSPLPMASQTTYLIVMKIVAAAENPDQLMIRVLQPHEPIGQRESESWTVTTPLSDSDDSFSLISLYFNGKQEQRIDEIRIGSTWASVTYPWWTTATSEL